MNLRRLLLGLVPFTAAVAVVGAAADTPAQRLGQIRRNYALLEILVDNGLELAAEDDPLQRASVCNDLAEQLAEVLRDASRDREPERVVELGNLLQEVLVRGVADNLSAARFADPLAAPPAKEIASWVDKAAALAKPVEEALEKAPKEAKEAMTRAVEAVAKGRGEIEKIAQWKGPPTEKMLEKMLKSLHKGKGKGKGKGFMK